MLDVSALATRGYANVPYPAGLREKVLEAVEAWQEFCALPHEIKQRVSYSGDLNVSGVGYELKLIPGGTQDLKENFHLRLSEQEFLTTEAAKIGNSASVFIHKGLELTHLVEPVIESFAAAVEEQFKMAGFVNDVRDKRHRVLLRFLHYFGNRKPQQELAVPHADKGGFTLHLYENRPGLEYLNPDFTWKPMIFTEDETAIIPALRLQHRSENQLKATYHRVLADDESAKYGRYSAVCFVDFANTPYFDKARVGRQQDQPVGFNYQIPLEEFRKMFTS